MILILLAVFTLICILGLTSVLGYDILVLDEREEK